MAPDFSQRTRNNLRHAGDTMSNWSRGGQRRPSQNLNQRHVYQEIPFKGYTVPARGVRSGIRDAVKTIASAIDPSIGPKSDSGHVVVHCSSGPGTKYTGVYSPFYGQDLLGYGCLSGYQRNPELTKAFIKEMGSKNVKKLKQRGYCFQLCRNNRKPGLIGHMNGKKVCVWYLVCEDGNQYVEYSVPRARDKSIWNDPDHLRFLNSDDVLSTWHDVKAGVTSIGITPLETVKRALEMDFSVPRSIMPQQYQKAADFSTWDRAFVLHADPRTCQLPFSWIDSLMGVYSPVKGRVVGGYPVYERQHNLTKKLLNTISDPVTLFDLESQGIRLSNPVKRKQFLYVHNNFGGTGQSWMVATPSFEDMAAILDGRQQPVLVGQSVPHEIDFLLTDPAFLFKTPDRAFATWSALYDGHAMRLHVGFTPEEHFRHALNLAAVHKRNASQAAPRNVDEAEMEATPLGNIEPKSSSPGLKGALEGPSQKKRKKKKKRQAVSDEQNSGSSATPAQSESIADGEDSHDVTSKEAHSKLGKAYLVFRHLASLLNMDPSGLAIFADEAAWGKAKKKRMKLKWKMDMDEIQSWNADSTLQFLLETNRPDPAWLTISDDESLRFLEAALASDDCSQWIKDNASHFVTLFAENKLNENLIRLLDAGVSLTAESVSVVFSSMPKKRGDQHNNKIAKIICEKCAIEVESKDDFHLVQHAAFDRIGKAGRKDLSEVLKKGSSNGGKIRKKRSNVDSSTHSSSCAVKSDEAQITNGEGIGATSSEGVDRSADETSSKQLDFKKAAEGIQEYLNWYVNQLDTLVTKASEREVCADLGEMDARKSQPCTDENDTLSTDNTGMEQAKSSLTSEQVVTALSKCESEDALATVENEVDLFQWDSMSEWTIDITEKAHKWLTKHRKRERKLCERIIRRLILLSTGRWPYVLRKRLKCSGKINLYETKIDKAGRIIWEVAIAFSPRRSSLDSNYYEQVIRVWDIVLDHDNLSSAIDRTIERIQKSHRRGEECALYAEIDNDATSKASAAQQDGIVIPRVFASQEVTRVSSALAPAPKGRSRHFHPASDGVILDLLFLLIQPQKQSRAARPCEEKGDLDPVIVTEVVLSRRGSSVPPRTCCCG